MTQIQVVFYSMYGHVYEMAKEVASGVSEVAGTHVDLYQVQELIPDDRLQASGAKAAREAFSPALPLSMGGRRPRSPASIPRFCTMG